MHYNVYFTSKKLNYDDGIWSYAIYENNKKKIFSDSKYVSLVDYEFHLLPICAALLRMTYFCNKSDLITVMTRNDHIISIIRSIQNDGNQLIKYPILNKYYQSDFIKIRKQIGFASIPSSWTYYSQGLFKSNKSFDYQENLEKKLLKSIQKIN